MWVYFLPFSSHLIINLKIIAIIINIVIIITFLSVNYGQFFVQLNYFTSYSVSIMFLLMEPGVIGSPLTLLPKHTDESNFSSV